MLRCFTRSFMGFSSDRQGSGAWVLVVGHQAGYTVLLYDDVPRVFLGHHLDAQVFVAAREQEVRAVLPHVLVVGKAEREALETSGGCTFADEFKRLITA